VDGSSVEGSRLESIAVEALPGGVQPAGGGASRRVGDEDSLRKRIRRGRKEGRSFAEERGLRSVIVGGEKGR
jgi:hypothetical protein